MGVNVHGWGGNGEIITSARTNVCGDNQKWINTFLMRPRQTESLLCNYGLFAQLPGRSLFIYHGDCAFVRITR